MQDMFRKVKVKTRKKTVQWGLVTRSAPETTMNLSTPPSRTTPAPPSEQRTYEMSTRLIERLCQHLAKVSSTGIWEESLHSHIYLVSSLVHHKTFAIPTLPQPSPQYSLQYRRAVSLRELLTRTSFDFSLTARLQLAALLASSVLQLFSSGWLTEDWDSQDIVFPESPDGLPVLESPQTLAHFFGVPKHQDYRKGMSVRERLNTPRIMLSLGIVLCELRYKKCWKDIMPASDRAIEESMLQSDRFFVGRELVHALEQVITDPYREVVRQCIYGMSDIQQKQFGNDVYEGFMYTRIVCQLYSLAAMANGSHI